MAQVTYKVEYRAVEGQCTCCGGPFGGMTWISGEHVLCWYCTKNATDYFAEHGLSFYGTKEGRIVFNVDHEPKNAWERLDAS